MALKKNNMTSYFKSSLESLFKFSNNMLLSEIHIQSDVEHNNTSLCSEAFHLSRYFRFHERQFVNELFTRSCQAQWFEI